MNVDIDRVSEDVTAIDDDDAERLQQQVSQESEFVESPAQQVDSEELERPKEDREDEQKVGDQHQQQEQQIEEEEDEQDERRGQSMEAEENKIVESENCSVSEIVRQSTEEEPEIPQQPQTEQQQLTKPDAVDSQVVNEQVETKTSTTPEKKQQVAVVHAHERSLPSKAENRALNRLQRQEMSVRRQPTLESHLSIESTTSSPQLSQASQLWRNEEQQVAAPQSNFQQPVDVLQQHYEQLKYQFQQQLELQRSQLEREYLLREEQMKQQMMMQWQYFTQQQQQQAPRMSSAQMYSAVRQDNDTRFPNDPNGYNTCPPANDVCHAAHAQQVQPSQTELAGDRQLNDCADVIRSSGSASGRVDCSGDDVRPVVVDVVSHTRSRGDGRGGGGSWLGHDGGHCRIIVGDPSAAERRPTTNSETESVEQRGGGVCCDRCRQPCDSSDGM